MNKNKEKKPKKEENLLSLHYNLRKNNKFRYKNSENKSFKIDKPNEVEHKESNGFNVVDLKKSPILIKSTFITLDNYKPNDKQSHYAYIKRNNIYTRNTHNSNSVKKNADFNNIKNVFIQLQAPRKDIQKQRSQSAKSPPKKVEKELTTSTLDYIDATYRDTTIINPLQPHYVYVPYFTEMKRYMAHYNEINEQYENEIMPRVKKFSQDVTGVIRSCNNKKNELKKIINLLENPEKLKNPKGQYDAKFSEYKTKMSDYVTCLLDKFATVMTHLPSIKNDSYKMQNRLKCTNMCETKIFYDMIGIYILEFDKMPCQKFIDYLKSFKDSFESGVNLIEKIENEINKNDTINSVKFTQEDTKYIIGRFDTHLSNVKKGIDGIKYYSTRYKLILVTKTTLKYDYDKIAYYYSLFKVSKESVIFLENALKNKEKILHNLFAILVIDLEKKVSSLMDSEYFTSETNTIIADCNDTLKLGEGLYKKNAEILADFALHTNLKIIDIKKGYDEKMTELETLIKQLKDLTISIKNENDSISLEKNTIQKLKENRPQNPQQKAQQLIDITEKIRNNKRIVSKYIEKIRELYEEVKDNKNKIKVLTTTISGQQKNLETLIKAEKENGPIKEEIKGKMEYIAKSRDEIKKIISLNEIIKENALQVENCINEALFNKEQFINEKKKFLDNITSINTKFYKYNLQEFVDHISKFLGEHKDVTQTAYTKDDIEKVRTKTTELHEKLKGMKCDNVSEILENLHKESDSLLKLKNNILKDQLTNMNSQLSHTITELRIKYEHLKNSLSGYSFDKEKLENYKKLINERKNKFLDDLHENEDNVAEGINTYNEFLTIRDPIVNKESSIFSEINELSEKIRNMKNELPSYDDAIKKLKNQTGETYSESDSLLQKFNTGTADLNLSEQGKEFNTIKDVINDTMNEIENLKKCIDNIKILNAAIKSSEINRESIDELQKKKTLLIEKVNEHIQAIKNDYLIEENEKTTLVNTLEGEATKINKQLDDTFMNSLKIKINETFEYSKNSKEKISNNDKSYLEKLDENKITWDENKAEIDKLNSSYESLNSHFGELIKNKNSEIVALIDQFITKKGNEINGKSEKHMKYIENMKTQLNTLDFKKDIKEDVSTQIKVKINTLNETIKSLLTNIDQKIEQLKEVKRMSIEYIKESNEEKDKNIEFNEKKKKMEQFHRSMNNIYEMMNKIEKEINTLNSFNNVELPYENILIEHITQQINDENAKAKKVMKEIEYTAQKIEEIKDKTKDETQTKLTDFNYKTYLEAGKGSSSNIDQIIENSTESKKKVEKSTEMNEIKNIKEQFKIYLQTVVGEHDAMQKSLAEIKNVSDLLISSNAKTIVDGISKNTIKAEGLSKQTTSETNKIEALISIVNRMLDEVKIHKRKIDKDLKDEQIDQTVDEIKKIKEEVVSKRAEIDTCLYNTKEYKENCLSEIRNAKRGKTKIDFLREKNENNVTNLKDIDVDAVNDNIAKCENYYREVEIAENKAKEKYASFLKRENDIVDIFNQSLILGIQAKSEKRKNEAASIMSEIEDEHSKIKLELQQLKQKIDKLNEEHHISEVKNELNNKQSTEASANIQYNLDKVKQQLSHINTITLEVEKIFNNAKTSQSSIPKFSPLNGENNLENAEKVRKVYVQHLSKIKNEKQLLKDKQKKLGEIKSDIEKIENELRKQNKIYEIGLLEKIKEIADKRKLYIEITKNTLSSSMKSFASLFIESDLNGYDINANLEEYTTRMNKINHEFEESYNLIIENATKVSSISADYREAKKGRENAQEEELKLKNKMEVAEKYLSDIKKKESLRLIYHLKKLLDKLNDMCKVEHSKVNGGYNEIKKIIEEIKNLDDVKTSSDKFTQVENKNNEIRITAHYSNNSEAQKLLGYIIKSANFIDVKSLHGPLPWELTAEERLGALPQLKFESETEIKLVSHKISENELKVYENMKNANKTVFQIFKYSDDIEKKQKESENLIKLGKDVCLKIKSIRELKDKVKTMKSNKRDVLVKIEDIFKKDSDINKIIGNYNNYDIVLEKSESDELKKLRDSFSQEKDRIVNKSKLIEIKGNFDRITESLDSLENEVEKLNATESVDVSIQKGLSSIAKIHQQLESIVKDIENINSSLDTPLESGKKYEMLKYKLVKENIKSKISDDLAVIRDKQKNAQGCVAYIKSNYVSIFNDISTLHYYFGSKSVSSHASTNVQECTKLSTELTAMVNESEEIIKNIRKEFIEEIEKTDISTLENRAQTLLSLYNELRKKKNTIDDFYKKINLVKLQEIKETSNKHTEITKVFDNIVKAQNEKLLRNYNSIEDVKKDIIGKEMELLQADSSFKLESIKKFHEIYENIMINIQKLKELEQINNREDENLKTYVHQISNLAKRNQNLQRHINEYENGDTINVVSSRITDIKDILHRADNEFTKLLNSINENENLHSNNKTMSFISNIMEKLENVKRNFLKNLPEKEKLFQIENNLNEIKGIINEIKTDYDVQTFVEKMSKNIEDEVGNIKDYGNKEKLMLAMQNIKNYEEETNDKLYKFSNALERVKRKKEDMDNILSTISLNNTSVYSSSKNFVHDASVKIKELDSRISKIRDLKNNIDNKINHLDEELSKLLNPPNVKNSSDDQNALFTESEKNAQNKTNDSENNKSENDNHSYSKYIEEKIRLAGGIIIGFTICFGLSFAIFKNKEEKEKAVNAYGEDFEGDENINSQDKDELIEVCFKENDCS
ncbi:reticulocyte binding protein 2b (RBP2b) [Plasmodium ovale curtisi]|uniref:Reticulocyte binding protein 2b (RBP2b) n=1 Tax=Plasmodium ovale curtisi TaxID=864141 RepID=A0A1A8XB12_PLAOA|nr:reticulocyte binding protein 2b (RBP2b) [Plasmodium ovale curtisi]